MPPGYHGCYLRIDLSRGRTDRVPLSESVLRQYIGGSGLGTRLLLDEGGATAERGTGHGRCLLVAVPG